MPGQYTLSIVTILLDNKLSPDIQGGPFDGALHAATATCNVPGHREAIKFVLERRAIDVPATTPDRNIALHHAARIGNMDVVQLIPDHKFLKNRKNGDNPTAADLAAGKAQQETAKLLGERSVV